MQLYVTGTTSYNPPEILKKIPYDPMKGKQFSELLVFKIYFHFFATQATFGAVA